VLTYHLCYRIFSPLTLISYRPAVLVNNTVRWAQKWAERRRDVWAVGTWHRWRNVRAIVINKSRSVRSDRQLGWR